MMWTIEINTDIVPKGRPRFFNGRAFTPKETRDCELKLQVYFKRFMTGKLMIPKGVDIILSADIYVKGNKADIDNYLKILMDSGNKILYADDKQIIGYDKTRLHRNQKYGKIILLIEPLDYLLGND